MKILKSLGIVLCLSFAAKTASAQSLTLRLEPGVAIPVTDPQAQRFNVGAALAVKPELGLGSYLSLGPAFQVVSLHSRVPGFDAGTATSLGGFVRVKRPHDEKNTGSGLSAASPWVDADARYVSTGPLDRLGLSVGAGVSVPTSDSRWLWIGPFARYDLVNQEDGKLFVNTNSAKTVIAGLSFEFGAPIKTDKVVVVSRVEPTPPPPVVNETKPQPKEDPTPVVLTFKPKIQFAWDSAVIDSSQESPLGDVVKAMLADTSYNVKIEGHASSEGQVEHNNKLSLQRAQAVADFLTSHGVDKSRLSVQGFGSKKPVADNSTEAGRKLNRRVEFDITFTLVKGNK